MNKNLFQNILGQTSPFPISIEVSYAKGSKIYDNQNQPYLDLISGVAVNNLGHGHPKIIEAVNHQTSQYMHVMVYGEFIQQIQLDFAQNLTSLLPESLNAVYPLNSGTEANEAALKLAKRVTGRTKIIACKGAYHGGTHGSLSISSNETKKFRFRPLLPDVYFMRFNNVDDLNLIDNKTACVIIETVQGDAGVRIPSKSFLKVLKEKCQEVGALLIFDEIQCGMGRTGKMFAFEHFGVTPDILTLGKALGGGLPIGALVANKNLLQYFSHNPILGHITTFGGNPVCMASANAALYIYKTEIDFEEVEKKAKFIEESLNHPAIKEIRRIGMMFAVEFENAQIVQQIVERCINKKVLTFWFLSCPESFRLAPPLNINFEDLKSGIDTINIAINEIC